MYLVYQITRLEVVKLEKNNVSLIHHVNYLASSCTAYWRQLLALRMGVNISNHLICFTMFVLLYFRSFLLLVYYFHINYWYMLIKTIVIIALYGSILNQIGLKETMTKIHFYCLLYLPKQFWLFFKFIDFLFLLKSLCWF